MPYTAHDTFEYFPHPLSNDDLDLGSDGVDPPDVVKGTEQEEPLCAVCHKLLLPVRLHYLQVLQLWQVVAGGSFIPIIEVDIAGV